MSDWSCGLVHLLHCLLFFGLRFWDWLSTFFLVQSRLLCNSTVQSCELGTPLILSGDLCTTLCTVLNFFHEWLVLWFSSLASFFIVFCSAILGLAFNLFLSSIQVIMQFNRPNLWIGDPFYFKWGPMYNFMNCIKLLWWVIGLVV